MLQIEALRFVKSRINQTKKISVAPFIESKNHTTLLEKTKNIQTQQLIKLELLYL